MFSLPAEVPERVNKQADNLQVDMVVFRALENAQSGSVIQAKLQVLVKHRKSMRLMLHAGGIRVETDRTVNHHRTGNKLSGKEGEPVHENVGRTEATGAS